MKSTNFKIAIERKHHQIDAINRPLGRLACQIANLLSGKYKRDFTPNIDNGDFVTVINFKNFKLTGKKLEQKKYFRFSGYPGGLTTTKLSELLKTNPEEIIRKTVMKMLPKNRLQKDMIKRLTFK